ncbi:hypothetical protein MTX78_08190 [Hymenobacter tibetensis]|uniref:Uncharacterized protein n=1 Tax=Hymenobacter tibetensis TaxID=497967 RepID=A0ABY4D934_9BACT|nr:hypothetical protein [Hymenobacter tibetensis]UOG76568.1 hypothetical protein MTX78_08190 [Hymenobacter tibetensis]
MALLNQKLKEQIAAQPEALVHVVLTSSKTTTQLQAVEPAGKIAPIPGLDGIYKGTFTGQQLLALENQPGIDSIETDQEVVALDGE